MQLAYQVPILQLAVSNASLITDWFRVPVGSSLSEIISVTAVVGVPAATVLIQGMNTNGDYINLAGVAIAAIGTFTLAAILATEFIRLYFNQAGGANTMTISIDFIVQPPDSTSA